MNLRTFGGLVLIWLLARGVALADATVTGELKKWHRITVTLDGPEASEQGKPNPFRDYRLLVTFSRGSSRQVVQGFFAADGQAAESGATSGNKWRAHFTPDALGQWQYTVSFRRGRDLAISLDPKAGQPLAPDGTSGVFQIAASDKTGRDHRGRGALRYVGQRYLRFAESGDYFLKGGADSPENFLGYADFDGDGPSRESGRFQQGEASTAPVHRYEPHLGDWRPGDPTWRGGRGKGIIGALNYLSSKGMNSVYFLTMNVGGDGKDVWPWTAESERYRFDCSKLDQWEIVFSQMDRLGIMLHVITQETENDQLLDGGELGVQRQLYYRELVARFGHHLAVTWNLGEENTNTTAQRMAFAKRFHDLDPYDHPVVVHTYPGKYDEVYGPLLGYPYLEGPSLQTNDTRQQTIRWLERSARTDHPWVVCLDEIGPANTGVKPDADDPAHDEVRKRHLWANLMAGGAGCEWYFGYKFAHNDLNCEDWRSRDRLWDQTRFALEFFQRYLPFSRMERADELTSSEDDYCLAAAGEVYAIYLPSGGSTWLDLQDSAATFDVLWYNPRSGGELVGGSVGQLSGPGRRGLGLPPEDEDRDWVALVRK